MNTYSIKGRALGVITGPAVKATIKEVTQCLAHASLFGVNVVTTCETDEKGNILSEVSFELPYSLSPIIGSGTKEVIQTVYDSSCQETREYIDRPYPRAGNMVTFAVFGEDKGFRKDVNNFIKIPLMTFKREIGGDDVQVYIVVAKVNSGLSDFYNPLEDYKEYMEIIDAESSIREQLANDLTSTINSSAQLAAESRNLSNLGVGQTITRDLAPFLKRR